MQVPQPPHVVPRVPLEVRIPQQRGRVVGGHHRNARVEVHLLPQAFEAGLGAQQGLGGDAAEAADQARLQDRQLTLQVRFAGTDLRRQRVAVLRRAAFEDVADEDVLAGEADGGDDLRQQLAAAPDERLALTVLVLTGGFADEDDVGLGIALAEDGVGAPAGQVAGGARQHQLAQAGEGLRAVASGLHEEGVRREAGRRVGAAFDQAEGLGHEQVALLPERRIHLRRRRQGTAVFGGDGPVARGRRRRFRGGGGRVRSGGFGHRARVQVPGARGVVLLQPGQEIPQDGVPAVARSTHALAPRLAASSRSRISTASCGLGRVGLSQRTPCGPMSTT